MGPTVIDWTRCCTERRTSVRMKHGQNWVELWDKSPFEITQSIPILVLVIHSTLSRAGLGSCKINATYLQQELGGVDIEVLHHHQFSHGSASRALHSRLRMICDALSAWQFSSSCPVPTSLDELNLQSIKSVNLTYCPTVRASKTGLQRNEYPSCLSLGKNSVFLFYANKN